MAGGDYPSTDERIADALERIANSLETIASDDFQLNVGLTDVDAAAGQVLADLLAAVFVRDA